MTQSPRPRPIVLAILDGWGHRSSCEDNAICQGKTTVLDDLARRCPQALIDASEHYVGLPEGQMGNSEVGHMNLGAGRVVLQELPRINAAIKDGSLASNPALGRFIEKMRASGGTAHIMGLLSPGGVHSHQDHIAALAEILLKAGLPVAVHGFLDGRDAPPRSVLGYIKTFESMTTAPIATLCGRYYTMDRDKRWDRLERGYRCIAEAQGERASNAFEAVEAGYSRDENDEFLRPAVIGEYAGMADGDGLLMANFRADRAREILGALLDPNFDGFERPKQLHFAAALGMTSYSEQLDALLDTIFPPVELHGTLGEVIATAGLTQLRIAETEKYAHVTFFFNGGREAEFAGEDRILVPSPKVATYDLQPEMSAAEVTDKMVEAIEAGRYDLIVANYANGDMVGHSGNLKAAILAVEAVDHCIGRLAAAVEAAKGCLLVTADHGNAEQMSDSKTGQAHTAHTMNRVPLTLVNGPGAIVDLTDGCLADITPTILALMDLPQPAEMTGRSLLSRTPIERGAAAE